MPPGGVLLERLQTSPHTFVQPSLPLYTDAVAYLKNALDPLAADISHYQQERQRDERKKRKRGQQSPKEDVLRLKQIHVDGFGPEQVWEQARRVIEAAREEAERGWAEAQARKLAANGDITDEDSVESEIGEEGVDFEVEGVDTGNEVYIPSDEDEEEEQDVNMHGQHDFDDMDMKDEDDPTFGDDDRDNDEPQEEFVADKFGLNDGFFSIDDFNRRSEFLEQQDAAGDDDGAGSDEEDVDWNANPLGASNGTVPDDQEGYMDADDDDDDEKGPTFGDPDAESEDDDMELEESDMNGMSDMANTNTIMYKDFFAPPASKKKKKKKPKNDKSKAADQKEKEDEVDRTIASVHRDLFEDSDSAPEDEQSDQEALDPSDPRSRRSAHERRKAALAEEIRKLEAANVAKRQWTLSGEARAADRPVNSLLEEDLEFERIGKPVPVITAELNESIEDLIKRRILAHDFQDIPRRRPDDLATGNGGRRGRLEIELDNEKSKKGLAEIYEEEHLRRTDENFVDERSEKTKKEESDIASLWAKIRTELDGLSSWNFRPKAPEPTIEIRTDAPVVAMEDARPGAAIGGDMAVSQLAPQEVYKAGQASKEEGGEVVGKSGLAASKEELSREEKQRRRRREKERQKKAGQNESLQKKKAKQGKDVVGDLKKGGVKIIGKKGEVRDVDGNEVRAGTGNQAGAGQYKL